MDKNISIVGPIVVFYKYRTARLTNWSCCIPLTPSDMDYMRRKMSRNGLTLDNHIVFATEKSNFMYSDNNLYIGGTVVPGAW